MSQQSSPTASPVRSKSRLAWVAFALGAVWIASLLVMVLTTANPVTINVAQVHESTIIVAATVRNINPGEIEVTDVLAGADPGKTVSVRNLTETPAQTGSSYLIPLIPAVDGRRRIPNVFDITPTGLPAKSEGSPGLPLIYPDSAESRAMLNQQIQQ